MLISGYDALLLDLDGTVWHGDASIPGAVDAINAAITSGRRAAYITNNASKAPRDVASKLQSVGLKATEKDVMTSAQAAVQLAQQHAAPGAAVLVVGADSFRDLVREAGFTVVDSADDAPAVVLHGHSPDNGWRHLSEAALAIQAGATYLASNLDSTLPMDRGFMVGNGSMVAAVTNATGVTPRAAGKPGPAMFTLTRDNLGVTAPLVIGDRLDTDIAGGVAAGMDTLHVLTGVSGPRALISAPADQRPTFIAEDMSVLVDASVEADQLRPCAQGGFTAAVERDDDTGGSVVVLDGGDETSTSMQALRTVLKAAWSLGAGEVPDVEAASAAARRAVESWW
ncbi:HAD-IIA family hydrolase [Corynebacterium sp. CCUG 71335]|uniref:HAD-IIA family hydrolase n=1 Tax=Corynebacterium sp. CCUG 71335 TaxID=2823892 RepID=UPI00210ADA1C|nr:HAD-IIA family hydrolase [Corynebacterium sp. CCUG 71335]MCQ4620339.1 HAD-IIA family hydrolase [Corynebacterium sp. CCUG 71335]